MIFVSIDDEGKIKEISDQLGALSGKAPRIMVNALNATGRNVTTMLKKSIRQRYTYNRSVKEAFANPQRANSSHMDYTIRVSSSPEHLTSFKTSPAGPSGRTPAKVRVLKQGGSKTIGGGTLQAFIARFASGKAAVVQRQPGQLYTAGGREQRAAKWGRHADMTKLKAFFGPSLSKMTEVAYREDEIEKSVNELLQKNIRKYIDKTLGR